MTNIMSIIFKPFKCYSLSYSVQNLKVPKLVALRQKFKAKKYFLKYLFLDSSLLILEFTIFCSKHLTTFSTVVVDKLSAF